MFRSIAATMLLAAPAYACEVPIALSDAQVRDALATLSDGASQGYDKVLAFQTLSCSDQLAVRQLGQEAALASGESSLQAAIVFEAMMTRESLILRPVDSEAMTEEEREYARANPSIVLDFKYSDRAKSCLSMSSSDRCDSRYSVDVRGNGITIVDGGDAGELAIDEGGDLSGFFFPSDTGLQIPVTAELF